MTQVGPEPAQGAEAEDEGVKALEVPKTGEVKADRGGLAPALCLHERQQPCQSAILRGSRFREGKEGFKSERGFFYGVWRVAVAAPSTAWVLSRGEEPGGFGANNPGFGRCCLVERHQDLGGAIYRIVLVRGVFVTEPKRNK